MMRAVYTGPILVIGKPGEKLNWVAVAMRAGADHRVDAMRDVPRYLHGILFPPVRSEDSLPSQD